MRLIVGLGNTGARYAGNRHNIGFQVVDVLAQRYQLSFDRMQQEALVATGQIGDQKVLLAKPQTLMNNSGRAVAGLVRFYKLDPRNLMVVYDDLDLPLGRIRVRPEGGSGGQKGVKSIIQHLGTEEFARLRVGIGRPEGRMEPAAYVLQDFSTEQKEEIAIARQQAADALETWLQEDIVAAMNRFNA